MSTQIVHIVSLSVTCISIPTSHAICIGAVFWQIHNNTLCFQALKRCLGVFWLKVRIGDFLVAMLDRLK